MHFARQAGNALCMQENTNCNTRLSKIMKRELLNHYQHIYFLNVVERKTLIKVVSILYECKKQSAPITGYCMR